MLPMTQEWSSENLANIHERALIKAGYEVINVPSADDDGYIVVYWKD